MKLLAATAFSVSLLASASAQTNQTDSQAIKIIRRGSQPTPQATGRLHRRGARPSFVRSESSIARVRRPCYVRAQRQNGVAHAPSGPILIVTAGTGRVQGWGDAVDEIRQGDLVLIPPDQKHWHGAAPNTSMAHIGIVEQLDGKTVGWMEKVTDAQYGAPLRAQRAAPTVSRGDRRFCPRVSVIEAW